jgi:protein-tyrosine phosphatase
MGVKRINFLLGGNGTGDPNVYPAAIRAIVEANHNNTPVLVHCQSGAQRTGGVIAAYRILVEGKSNADAFAEAQLYGRSNPKLIPFVEEHLPEWKQSLAREHVIPGN